ncbi:hypothetical protein ACN267_07755 [Micromonospora sp. WMMD734]|uniref:Meckel syndrome type 1 protein n=1 Tax=Micromonospora humidisoli TaxID=2807622 RepID=A0ABS2JHG2_9ACTN|nr:hypothetical protein [Micromonospora humidisoli]MBM7085480.1 hypothetical protein [Micromonospora humidisoli]
MNIRRSARSGRRVSRAEAERLLGPTAPGVAPSTDDPLTRLLAAAAAPARPDEFAGEQAALAAFRAARGAPAPGPDPAGRRRPRLTTGVVAWIAGLAATATAGVAFATVALDRPAERTPGPVPSVTGTGSVRPSPFLSEPSRQTPSRRPGGTAPGGGPSAPPAPPGPPAPGGPANAGRLVGQCRAYLAKPPAQRAKALTRPGFADLVAAAGGPDRVEAYCRALVPQRPTSAAPGGAGGPHATTGPPATSGGPAGTGGGPGPKN